MKNKTTHSIVITIFYVIIPLTFMACPTWIQKLTIVCLACFLIFYTQPNIDWTKESEFKAKDKSSVLIIFLAGWISLTSVLFEWYTQGLNFIGWDSITIFGIIAVAVGLGIRISAIKTLRDFFTSTVEIKDNHQLIQNGPFQLVRHPSYTGSYIIFLGIALLLESGIGGIVSALLMGLAYYYRIKVEEEALIEKFGDQYLTYQRSTSRMVPWVW